MDLHFDYVVYRVRPRTTRPCPLFPGKAKVVHAGFDDPPKLAADADSEEEALAVYRRVRDEIRDFVARLPERLEERENHE